MAWIGIISDTHGLLRPEAVERLRGVTRIVHVGDIGAPEIVPRLQDIAPVTAIRGNIDTAEWAMAAEPMPASLEKAARRKPWISTPTKPPATPSGLKAPVMMAPKAAGISAQWTTMTTRPAST